MVCSITEWCVSSCSDSRHQSLSSLDGQSYEVTGAGYAGVVPLPSAAAAGASDVSGSPPVHYWKPMCVALKYDAYSLAAHDYAATATTTTTPAAAADLDDDVASGAVVTPPPSAAVFSTVDRRHCFPPRQAGGRAARLPAARICRPTRCDEHLYEPATNHDAAAPSRDLHHHHRTFVDFGD